MKREKVNLSELRMGPIRQVVLPEGFIVRVQRYKEVLREVEIISLEETVSNFQRDLLPERELKIWENIAHLYDLSVRNNPDWTIEDKKQIFGELLTSSLG